MASQPVKQQLLDDIDVNGWDAVFERVASGESQTSIAKSFGVSQGFFSRVMNLDPARTRAFREAKRQAATYYAERAMDLADNVEPKRDAIAKVREQIGVLKWLATAGDREQYGDAMPGVNISLNVGELHLAALRHRIVEGTRPGLLAPKPEDDPTELTPPNSPGCVGGVRSL